MSALEAKIFPLSQAGTSEATFSRRALPRRLFAEALRKQPDPQEPLDYQLTGKATGFAGAEIFIAGSATLYTSASTDESRQELGTVGAVAMGIGLAAMNEGVKMHASGTTIDLNPLVNKIDNALSKATTRLPWRNNKK